MLTNKIQKCWTAVWLAIHKAGYLANQLELYIQWDIFVSQMKIIAGRR